MNKKISLIIPCYNEEKCINSLYDRLKIIFDDMKSEFSVDAEFIFVDDGSSDNTLQLVKQLAEKDDRINYISFSKNFGKEAAIYAGLENASGDYAALIDADLQDPPEMLKQMYEILQTQEYDCVAARRTTRKGEPIIRSWFARRFYRLMKKYTNVDIPDGARDFRLMTRQMLNSVLELSERNRFTKGIFAWVGYRTKWLEFENTERTEGKSKWSFFKLTLYAIDGIIAFCTFPLLISVIIGLIFCILAFLFIILVIVRKLAFGDPVAGWASQVCIMLFIAGLQLFCTGILGLYISKIYSESKARPIYIAREKKIFKK